MFLQASVAILNGSTYDKYAQIIKSCGLEAMDDKTYYKLIAGKVYNATKAVWNHCREHYVYPDVVKAYYELCGCDENGIVPLCISFDTRWQKRGTGKAYNSLDGTTFACDALTGYVLSIANQHRATASGYRKRFYHSRSFMQSSHMMDPTGTVLCIEDIMKSDYYVDVQAGLADGDGKWVEPAKKLKQQLQSDTKLHEKYPHLQNISTTIYQDLCLTHTQKNYIKLLKKSISEWKTQTSTKTLPVGSGTDKIVYYLQVAFHDVIVQKYNDDDERRNAILSIFDHLNEESDHSSGLCMDRDCTSSSDPNHIHLDPSLASHLKKATEKYVDEDLMQHLQILGNTNPLESLNQQMATIQPKFISRKNPNSYDAYSIIVALKSNHGSNILRMILMQMGFPNDMIPPNIIDHWYRLDNKKANDRYYLRENEFIARRRLLKRMAKANDNDAKKSNNKSLGSYKDF